MVDKIQYKGDDVLSKEEKLQLNKIVEHYYDKISRSIKNDFGIFVKIKAYEKAGKGKVEEGSHKKKKFSIQVQVVTSTRKLDSSSSDWDLNRTLHDVFKKMLSEIEHRFRNSDQHKR